MATHRIVDIDRAAFAAWLQRNPGRTFQRRSSCDCPLAKFVGETVGVWHIQGGRVVYIGYALAPEWASRFVAAVDQQPAREITAEEAQSILDQVVA